MTKHTVAIILVVFTIVCLANDALADTESLRRHVLSDIEFSTQHIDRSGYLRPQNVALEFEMTSNSGGIIKPSSLTVSLTKSDGYLYPLLVDVSTYFLIDVANQRLYLDEERIGEFYDTLDQYFEHLPVLTLLIEAFDSHQQLIYVAVSFRPATGTSYQSSSMVRHYYSIEPAYEGC